MAHIDDSDKDLTIVVLPPVTASLYWMVPSATGHAYVPQNGREEELRLLDSRIFDERREHKIASVLLYGSQDCGISDVVRHYIEKNYSHFPGGIFWTDAETPPGFYKCLRRMAVMVGEYLEGDEYMQREHLVGKIEDWLEQRKEWLLIVDMLSSVDFPTSDLSLWSTPRMSKKVGIQASFTCRATDLRNFRSTHFYSKLSR